MLFVCRFFAASVHCSSVRFLCFVCCDLSHLQTDVIAFNRSITSCEKAAVWHVAIGLVQHLTDEEMNRRGSIALRLPNLKSWRTCDEVEARLGKGT